MSSPMKGDMMDAAPPPPDFAWWQFTPHAILVALLSLVYKLGGKWVRKVEKDIKELDDKKADRAIVENSLSQLGARLERQDDTSAERHNENTKRMDAILMEISRGNREGRNRGQEARDR